MANNVDLVVGNIRHGLWGDVTDTLGACLGGTALWVKAVSRSARLTVSVHSSPSPVGLSAAGAPTWET
jgi:hypothetical protein